MFDFEAYMRRRLEKEAAEIEKKDAADRALNESVTALFKGAGTLIGKNQWPFDVTRKDNVVSITGKDGSVLKVEAKSSDAFKVTSSGGANPQKNAYCVLNGTVEEEEVMAAVVDWCRPA